MKKKHRICNYPIAVLLAVAGLGARAWSDTTTISGSPGAAITGIGTSEVQVVSNSTVNVITGVTVSLDIAGVPASGYTNQDLEVYLRLQNPGGEAITILLNGVGTTSSNPLGAADSGGFNVTFDDTAANDIHLYDTLPSYTSAPPTQPYTVTGTWQPDGRNTAWAAEDTDPRTNLLSALNGLSANGTWTLFAVDEETGSQANIVSYQVNITGTGGAFYWSGASGTSWATIGSGATNWSTAASGGSPILAIPTSISDVVFATGTAMNQGATTLDQDFTIHSLTDTDTTPVVINSGTGGTHTLTISNSSTTAITVGTGANLTINSNLTLAGTSNGIEVDGTGQATVAGILGGGIGLNKTGTGTLYLSNANIFTGGTTINGGTISFSNAQAFGTDATDSITVAAGAELNSTEDIVLANRVRTTATGSSTISAAMGTTLTLDELNLGGGTVVFGSTGNTGTVVIGPVVSGAVAPGSIIEVADGTLQNGGGIASLNLYTGNDSSVTTKVDAGATLDVHDFNLTVYNFTGTGDVTLGSQSTTLLTIGSGSFGGVISGAGGVYVNTAGTVTLTGASTYGAGTEVAAGTLQLGDGTTTGASLGTGTVLVDTNATFKLDLANGETFGNAITDGGHVVADDGVLSNYTISSVITGSGDFTKSGSNTVTVTGANTYQGGTTITGGTLQLGDGVTPGAALGTAGVIVNGGTTLAFDLADGESFGNNISDSGHIVAGASVAETNNYTISSNISGGGDLTKNGANTVTLTGTNIYNGPTTINAGTLVVNGSTASSAFTVNSGATLGGSGTVGAVTTWNGTIAPSAATPGVAGTTLHTNGDVTWNGGATLSLQLGSVGDQLSVGGMLNKGTVGAYTIDIGDAGIAQTQYILATFASTAFASTDFTLDLPGGYVGTLSESGTALTLNLSIAQNGPIIENAAPVNTSRIADFTVIGQVTTGGTFDNNTIHTLTFTPGGSLLIHNTLFVTLGPVILVNGSSITLDGNLSTSLLQMLPGSLLNGNGGILGDLINGGVVSPGHSPGIIRVGGNYTQLPTGLLQIQIGGRDISQHDLLAVNGTATLGGTLELQQLNGFKLRRNEPITFLTANGGVIRQFDNVIDDFVTDTILDPTVVYSANSVALEGKQGSFKKFAENENLTPNQQAVGGMLDSVVNDRRANSLIDYLDARILPKLSDDLEKISPDSLTSVFTVGTALAAVQSQNLQRRTDDLRSGSSGFNAANLAINGDGPSFSGGFDITTGVAGPNGPMDDGKEVKEMKQVAPAENRWGAFLSGTGDWVSVGDTNNARGYELESGGFTLGVDYKVCPNFAIGLMAGYTGTTSDLANNGRVYVNGGKVGVYATTFVGGWYADVAAFGGYDSYDTRRPALQGDARGSTEGGNLNALFGTGYDFKAGGFTFGPTASFNYTYVGTSAFDEYGSLAPLDIHGGHSDSLRTAFGIKASYDWKVGGIVVKPEVRAAWQHEYGDAAYDLDASLASGAGSGFTVAGPQLGRDSALVGAGFAVQCSERVSTYFYYDGELGRKNYESNAVTGGIRVAF